MTWSKTDVKATGELRKAYYRDRLTTLGRALADAKRDARKTQRECRFCFYFVHGLATQAFETYTCAACGEEHTWPNGATPNLCAKCADKLRACVRCGGTREWGDR